jgi:hypothetical protein
LIFLLPVLGYAQPPLDAGHGPGNPGRVFDRGVASVGGQLVTLSQLDFEARVLLVSAGGASAAFGELDQQALEASLAAIIDQRLATFEADKLDAYPLAPGELDQAVAHFRTRFLSDDRYRTFLAAHDATESDMALVLRRSLRARRVLDGKLRLKAQVSDAEARRLQADREDLQPLPLDVARQKLIVERFGALVRLELAQARRQVDVRLLGPFSPAPEGLSR